jgi:membrane-associated protease RseP (regulator of RpoE activity)
MLGMLPSPEFDNLSLLVSRVLHIDSVTMGDSKTHYIAHYRGKLLRSDSSSAYDELAALLKPHHITPLFREENNWHAIILIQGIPNPRPSKIWVNILFFVLTFFSVLFTGSMFSYQGSSLRSLSDILHFILSGVPFTLSLLSILLAHEFGHYLAGKHHKSNVTLPYFIPFPMSYFGTMGAFIQLKEPPKNRRVMLDISIAGPLAGLVVAIPILLLGLSLSPVERLPFHLPAGQIFEGNSILYLALKYIVHGEFLPNPGNYHGMTPFIYWVVYFFTGSPLPSGGFDVTLHPVAWAGWAGLLVTAINLIPAGQLDGGHLLYVLLGRRAPRLIPFVLAGLLILGFVWYGWWIWAVLILVFGTIYAEPLDLITPLDRKRKLIAILGIIIFLLVFTPVPLVQIMA